MNGWHRLWFLVTVIWGVLVAIYALREVDAVRPHFDVNPETLISKESRSVIEKKGGALVPLTIVLEREVTFMVPPNLSDSEEQTIVHELVDAMEAIKRANKERWAVVGFAAFSWIVSSLLLLLLGHSVAWVVRGFRVANVPNKAPEPTPGAVTPRATEGDSK